MLRWECAAWRQCSWDWPALLYWLCFADGIQAVVVSQGPVWERQMDVMDFVNLRLIRDTCETQRYPGLILGPQIQRVWEVGTGISLSNWQPGDLGTEQSVNSKAPECELWLGRDYVYSPRCVASARGQARKRLLSV